MSETKIKQSLKNLEKALQRLKEALNESPSNSLVIDGTIQRFEFVIELFWKTLKRMLGYEGIIATTPKETLKKAYAVNWLDNETTWLQMLNDRNETPHIYDENKAKEIYEHIKNNFTELNNTLNFLKNRFEEKLRSN